MERLKNIFNIKSDNISAAPVIVVSFLLVAGTITFLDMGDVIPEKKLASVSSIEFAETVAKQKDLVLIDIRTPEEFRDGHLPGAINIDYYSSEFAERLSELDEETRYAIYCRSGRRSGDALDVMKEKGFQWVIDLSGGIEELSANTEAMGHFGY